MYIYKTTNTVNGKIYIGLSKFDPDENQDYIGSGYLLKKAVKKYGKELFVKEILEVTEDKKHCLKQERYWISKLQSRERDIGYNICEGGTWGDNFKHHPNIEDYKKRCSERTKGENNPRYGDHRTYEEIHGKQKADKLKKLISKRFSGENNASKRPDVRKKISEGKMGYKNPQSILWILDTGIERYLICGGIKRKLKDIGLDYQAYYKTDDENVKLSKYGWKLIKLKKGSGEYDKFRQICISVRDG
jgi:group I intron endonuclease